MMSDLWLVMNYKWNTYENLGQCEMREAVKDFGKPHRTEFL